MLPLGLIGAGYFALGGLGCALSGAVKWRLALYGVLLYLCGLPLVVSALYWFNGAAVYTSGILPGLVLIELIGWCIQTINTVSRTVWGLLATIAAVLLAGTNELMALTAIVGITAWLLTTMNRTEKGWLIVLLIAASVGAAITVATPGNFVRSATVLQPSPWWYRLWVVGGEGGI